MSAWLERKPDGVTFEGKKIMKRTLLFKTSLKLGREIDDSNLIRSECSRNRRWRLSYLLEWAPAKRLRRWISINCPRLFMRLAGASRF